MSPFPRRTPLAPPLINPSPSPSRLLPRLFACLYVFPPCASTSPHVLTLQQSGNDSPVQSTLSGQGSSSSLGELDPNATVIGGRIHAPRLIQEEDWLSRCESFDFNEVYDKYWADYSSKVRLGPKAYSHQTSLMLCKQARPKAHPLARAEDTGKRRGVQEHVGTHEAPPSSRIRQTARLKRCSSSLPFSTHRTHFSSVIVSTLCCAPPPSAATLLSPRFTAQVQAYHRKLRFGIEAQPDAAGMTEVDLNASPATPFRRNVKPTPQSTAEKWSMRMGLGHPHKYYSMGLTVFIGLFSGGTGIIVNLIGSQVI